MRMILKSNRAKNVFINYRSAVSRTNFTTGIHVASFINKYFSSRQALQGKIHAGVHSFYLHELLEKSTLSKSRLIPLMLTFTEIERDLQPF